eukprot:CAMPEP_0183723014 /NCGR_PEP_ID=MMETSP0737-20130205/14769_1 /TAXON_ID=385413 /ORGANISM="Thalassiosira miniscula, Strain CCMP1093" /LENGTH=607 /DNA_ID=CAMNT_0025953265 /DNA_START=127 /DNA_END=1950 /DNA_ORIENTATION=-
MRHDDLNQSSRLDLDYDAEGDDFLDSSPRLKQIAESRSVSSAGSSDFSSSSSVDSTVVVEAASDEDEGAHGAEEWKQPSHESNGMASGIMRGVQREATTSTMNTSSSSSRNDGASKKIVKVKLWDPGQSSAEPNIVTVAMDIMPSSQGVTAMQDLSLGVGQNIQICEPKSRGARNYDGGEKSVDISFRPKPYRDREEWQPPLRISKEDQRRNNDSHGEYEAEPPMRAERHPSTVSIPQTNSSISTPKTEAAEEKNEPSESMPAPVKGLEPFTIPSILSSTVIKRTPTEKVGLAFRKAAGTVVIEKIVPGSAFDGTALRPGFECLSINGHRLRSARRAAEVVRESGSSLTLVASNAPRPPGTMYTMISLMNYSGSMSVGSDYAMGMYFKVKHGLVQLVKVDPDSPVVSTSMKAGDYILAINGSVTGSISKVVEVLSESNDDMVPILYFNMRQLRVSLVDKVIGDLWKKEWSDGYDECVVLQPGNGSSNPLTLRFKEEGMCELLDPLRAFRDNFSENDNTPVVPPDHPLNSVVETLNHGIICVLSAIKEGVMLQSKSSDVRSNGSSTGSKSDGGSGSLIGELAKLSEMYKEGLLSKDDFEAIKSKLLKA